MKDAIRIRTTKFLLTQAVIIVGIMAGFLVLAGIFFVRNAAEWRRHNIDEDLRVFAEQAAHSGEVPRRGDLGAHTFFILGADGRYILPRLPASDDSERMWEEHESMLRYEMQKRREGWSFYPERSPFAFNKGQRVLRYIFVEKMGWIVATEAYMPAPLELLKEIVTPSLFAWMLAISAAAFIFMLWNADWHFRRVTRAILRSQQNNFIESESVVPPVRRESTALLKSETRLPAQGPSGDMISGALHVRLPERPVPAAVPPGEPARAREEISRMPRPEPAVAMPAVAVPAERRRVDDLGNVAIDTTGIRSPVLRRAIEELREARR